MRINGDDIVFGGNTYPCRDALKSLGAFYWPRSGTWTLGIDKLSEARAVLARFWGDEIGAKQKEDPA
jgi:hypothetical protein